MKVKRIGVIGYNGVAAINLAGALEAFANAFYRDEAGHDIACYRVSTISCSDGDFITDSGLVFRSSETKNDEEPFDTVIIPGGRGMLCEGTCNQVADWINSYADQARRLASICTGIYALASTGLMEGRRITTHWEHARKVAARFPELKVEESALFLKDGKFYSSAGATAGIDLSLALIAEDFGQEVALRVARRLLVYLVRDGGQEQYSEPASFEPNGETSHTQINTGRMQKLVCSIRNRLGDDLSLAKLAKRALLSKHDFVVQFTRTFDVPPGLFVKNLRFNEARRRLAKGEKARDVANFLGFRDPAYFIQEFRRRFGCLPDEYQRRFGPASGSGISKASRCSDAVRRASPVASSSSGYQRPRIVSFTRCVRARRPRPQVDLNAR